MALTTSIRVSLLALLAQVRDLSTLTDPTRLDFRLDLSSGGGARQASKVYADRAPIPQGSGNALSIDLQSVQDAVGSQLSLTKVKALAVHHVAPAAGVTATNKPIRVGGGSWTALFVDSSDIIIVPSGGLFLLVAPTEEGFAVGPSNKVLKISNPTAGAAPATCEIVVVGA